MNAAVQAWLVSQLGPKTDLVDLNARYMRLGTARATAIEVIRERLAALRAQPSTINVSSVVGVSYVENIKAYERLLASLVAGDDPAPDDPTDPCDDGDNTLGLVYLVERPRR
ncbi:hypothetical protein OG693_39575 (plasmid) [Streptomyces sp. NBC_01259]|uniref:hypothetical protein n=1 Tax=Streptomyces sp. NBC_01259 TaxID=2903800 RepID=UPI002F91A194